MPRRDSQFVVQHELECQACSERYPPGGYPWGCPACRDDDVVGRLEVVFDFPDEQWDDIVTDGHVTTDMWRYRRLLPLLSERPVSLGEGGTPLSRVSIQSVSGDVDLYFKNETMNPTGSFKDRLNSLLLSNAKALGETHIATASTGNHGASTAAYASRAGMTETVVLFPPETDIPHRVQTAAYGARVAVTGYDDRRPLLVELVHRGWYPTVSPTEQYVGLPYSYEAYKTIAFELVEQFDSVPDAVVVPIGAGDGLYGTWKGFRELHAMGHIDETPRMYGCQPAERPSVARALDDGRDRVEPTPGPMPITTSTSGPSAGNHALRAIRESGGAAFGINREDVEAAIVEAARTGIFPEPASALSIAGAGYAIEDGNIDPGETVVSIVTGTGIKWPEIVGAVVDRTPTIEPTLDALVESFAIDVDAPKDR